MFDSEDDAEPLRKRQERGKTVWYLLLCRAKIQLTLDQDHREKALSFFFFIKPWTMSGSHLCCSAFGETAG